MTETAFPWTRYALIRIGLGVFGCLAALLIGFVFMVVWHWVALIVLWFSIGRGYGWVYAWDVIFLAILMWEGYHYKQRMPPPSPFTQTEQVVSIIATEHGLTTPAHVGYAGAEILYVAPRLFFWGWRQLMRVSWPAADLANTVAEVHAFLRANGSWTHFEDIKDAFPLEDMAERSVALLVKVGIAAGSVSNARLRFRAVEPEWV